MAEMEEGGDKKRGSPPCRGYFLFGGAYLTFPPEHGGCGILLYMSNKLKELLERVATRPDAAQEDLARE